MITLKRYKTEFTNAQIAAAKSMLYWFDDGTTLLSILIKRTTAVIKISKHASPWYISSKTVFVKIDSVEIDAVKLNNRMNVVIINVVTIKK